MFGKRKKMEHSMRMMQGLQITSKASLKQYCLLATQCNVDEAQKLYDFLIKDMEDLPMFDPVPPTWMDKTKTAADGVLGFVKDNQEGIMQVVSVVRGLMGKGVGSTASAVVENLPSING